MGLAGRARASLYFSLSPSLFSLFSLSLSLAPSLSSLLLFFCLLFLSFALLWLSQCQRTPAQRQAEARQAGSEGDKGARAGTTKEGEGSPHPRLHPAIHPPVSSDPAQTRASDGNARGKTGRQEEKGALRDLGEMARPCQTQSSILGNRDFWTSLKSRPFYLCLPSANPAEVLAPLTLG